MLKTAVFKIFSTTHNKLYVYALSIVTLTILFTKNQKHYLKQPMTETFTPGLDLPVKPSLKESKIPFSGFAEPSKNVINNILNFSLNLEVKKSTLMDNISLIKS